MTRAEILAFNSGVKVVLDLAAQTARAMEARLPEAPTRFNYAVSALDGVAQEGRALLLSVPPMNDKGDADGC